jgi:hypothetical protein
MEVVEHYNNTIGVAAGWLQENIVTADNYFKLCQRGHFKVVRRGGNGRTALIEYNSIPERVKAEIKKKLGYDPVSVSVLDAFTRHIVPDISARSFYEDFIVVGSKHLNPKQITEYYTNAIVLNAVRTALAEKLALRRSSGNPVGRPRESIFASVHQLHTLYNSNGEPLYPHTLPGNNDRLGRTFNAYNKEGYIYLIHGGMGCQNAAKINDKTKESFLIELLGDGRNVDCERVAEIYNEAAKRSGWKTITGSAVRVWLEKYDLETFPGRHGSSAYRNNKTMQAKRSKPTGALYFWSLDGWDVELLYQATTESRDGSRKTTYHHRPTVVVVLDPSVNYPIGYAIGDHETPELIKAALRNAANHTAELFGQRYRVLQIQSDRYQIKAMTPFYECIGEKYTPAAVKNAKSKPVERNFGVINNRYCHLMPNWSGYGVTSKKGSQPNTDQTNSLRKDFPDWSGVCRQVTGIMELIRNEKREAFLKLWANTPAENKLPLSEEKYLLAFGATNYKIDKKTVQTYTFQGSGITATINGLEQTFDCFDLEFRRHAGVQWTLLYDPDSLSKALAVNDDRTLQFTLENKYIQPMALRDRKDGDSDELQRVRDFNKLLEQHIIDTRASAGDTVRKMFDEHPELNDTLSKLLIVDSKGQHKDRRNDSRRRVKAAEIDVEDIAPALVSHIGAEMEEEIDIYKRF